MCHVVYVYICLFDFVCVGVCFYVSLKESKIFQYKVCLYSIINKDRVTYIYMKTTIVMNSYKKYILPWLDRRLIINIAMLLI